MKKIILGVFLVIVLTLLFHFRFTDTNVGAPPNGVSESEVPLGPFDRYKNWSRPNVPAKVGLQVGHWNNSELPDELSKLHGNTGAEGGGKSEWEVNFAIAESTATFLEDQGVEVDILPATVPEEYWADVFLAIHADGSTDTTKSGYKFASPWKDLTNDSELLVSLLESKYEEYTHLENDPNITKNMRGYYAFSWWRYDHAIHPLTTAAIAETGFLTNASDRKIIVDNPEVPAQAISEAILIYLRNEGLL